MEVPAGVIGVLVDDMGSVGDGGFGIDSGRIGGSGTGRCIVGSSGIVVDQLALILGKGLGSLLVDVAVDGMTKVVRDRYISGIQVGRETDLAGRNLVGGPRLDAVDDFVLGELGIGERSPVVVLRILAKSFGFGGPEAQLRLLRGEGVEIRNGRVVFK